MKNVRRLQERLRHPMTAGESIGLFVSLLLGIASFVLGVGFASSRLPATSNIALVFLYLACGLALPAFLAVALAGASTSWRHKPLGSTLLLFVLVGISISDIVHSLPHGFAGFLHSIIRFSAMMIGALLAILWWRRLGEKRAARAAVQAVEMRAEDRIPRVPIFLLILSLLSIPAALAGLALSMFVTIGLSALLLIAVTDLGDVPLFLIVAVALAPLIAVVSTAIAVVAIVRRQDSLVSGRRIDLASHPALERLLAEVCRRVGTRMPDNVVLLPSPNFFVTQTRLVTLDGPVRGRTVALGLPLLKLMNIEQLAAVLAHEFAHFSGGDTLFSTFAFPVYSGLAAAVKTMSASQLRSRGLVALVVWVLQLPEIHFLQALFWYFHSLNMILSRRRELRADWIAAQNFGTDAHVSALRLTEMASARFVESLKALPLEEPGGLFAAYAAFWAGHVESGDQDAVLEREERYSEFSSHPSARVRIASLPILRAPRLAGIPDVMTEMRADEIRVSRDFLPVVRDIQERLAAEAAAVPAMDDSSAYSEAGPVSESKEPGQVLCRKCRQHITPTFHGCCPKCGDLL